jgi:acetyl-CoA C-acetyltransferase
VVVSAAGNAGQFSDGSSAVIDDGFGAWPQAAGPLLGFAVYRLPTGQRPELACFRSPGTGPSGPEGRRHRSVGLNEAFAVQVLYCADWSVRLNVNGAIAAVGHPYGVTGQRLTGASSRRSAAGSSACASRCVVVAWALRASSRFCKPRSFLPSVNPRVASALLNLAFRWTGPY